MDKWSRIDLWLIRHDFNTRWPALYLFWDWVLCPKASRMGFKRWLQWYRRKD